MVRIHDEDTVGWTLSRRRMLTLASERQRTEAAPEAAVAPPALEVTYTLAIPVTAAVVAPALVVISTPAVLADPAVEDTSKRRRLKFEDAAVVPDDEMIEASAVKALVCRIRKAAQA